MKLKNIIAALLLVTALTVNANTIQLFQNQNSYSVGGEFQAITSDNGTFYTFCVDTSHDFTPGQVYSYQISQTTGYQAEYGNQNQLTLAVAWLYSSFLNGALNSQLLSSSDYGQLQYAIWFFQHENTGNAFTFNDMTDPFINDVLNNFENSSSFYDAADGAYGIAVMNLYDSNGNLAQSQLVQVVPDTANTLMLLFAGVVCMGLIKVKQIKYQ